MKIGHDILVNLILLLEQYSLGATGLFEQRLLFSEDRLPVR